MVAPLSWWLATSVLSAFAWNYHFLSQQDIPSLRAVAVPFFTANVSFLIAIVFLLGMLIGRFFEERGIFNLTLKDMVLEGSVRALRLLPGASSKIEQEQAKIVQQMKDKFIHDIGGPVLRQLPQKGMAVNDVLHALQSWSVKETQWQDGKVSGTVYHGGSDLSQLIVKAFEMYLLTNPLHVDVFPSVRKMEAEVVSMTANLFRGPSDLPLPVGTMTSGGTESIFLAMKSYRERGRLLKGITRPNMVVPVTAHAAFDKAAGLLGIELRHFAVDPITFQALPAAAQSCIDSNTVVVIGSAPSFAQGVIDPIQELAAAAKSVGAGCHVDCCLGSFLIAYAKRFKELTPHDFSVDGVTSISVDTHKFGFAPKGSSVILYRDSELRRFQYFSAPRWTGGIYATATVAGSRPGALIAACWAVMAHIGDDGYAFVTVCMYFSLVSALTYVQLPQAVQSHHGCYFGTDQRNFDHSRIATFGQT
jgi:sphinganine-1-phosphate aldolase